MRRFYIEQSEAFRDKVVIKGDDARHIINALRLGIGDMITLFDGTGHEYISRIDGTGSGKVDISVLERIIAKTESCVKITIAQAFLKEKKMDILVRQLTELGIARWFPFISERSVARPDKKRIESRIKRWKRISKESLKQCKRSVLPEIGELLDFKDMLKLGKKYNNKVVFWENETKPLDSSIISTEVDDNILVLIGPEGGFSEDEIMSAKEKGFVTAALGPRILKAETASVAACTLLQYLFGDMGKKS
jgi:16S rRNA (uracil1498-N3)-methyltransferase